MAYIYSDIEANLYDEWFGNEPYEDQAFYHYFIEQKPGKALEIGSGTGRLLLPYLRDGLDVEGLEPSANMIKICREKGQKLGFFPIIHQQAMEELSLDKHYMTIYIPFCSFQLVVDRQQAHNTLARFYDHLENNGQLLISLFIPEEEMHQQNVWRIRRTLEQDRRHVIVSEANRNDRFQQVQTQRLKYEIFQDGLLQETQLRTMPLRWYHTYEFHMMLENAGFKELRVFGDYTCDDATENSHTYIWRALKKSS